MKTFTEWLKLKETNLQPQQRIVQWTMPNIQEEMGEFQRTAQQYGRDVGRIVQAFQRGGTLPDKNPKYYHGTTDILDIKDKLLPPKETEKVQEKGRKKNLDKVFFTKDLGSARIYAGRAANRFGGNPIIFVVEPEGEIEELNTSTGTTVFMSPSARIVEKESGMDVR